MAANRPTSTEVTLQSLLEAADLVAMIEDLMHPTSLENLSPARASGMRICLKNVKQNILDLHEAIRGEERNGARSSLSDQVERESSSARSFEEMAPRVEVAAEAEEVAEPEQPRRRILTSPISRSITSTGDIPGFLFNR